MNKKARFIAILIIAILIPTATAQAYYAFVSGELRDSATNAIWTHGASVEIFNCNTLNTITTTVVSASGTFSVDISSLVTTTTPLCLEATFSAGPYGKPGNAAKGPYADRLNNTGTLSTGVYFTGTGPNAITLRDLNAMSTATPWPLIIGAVVVVAAMLALGMVMRRRTAKA
jgi:hypothetical protein